MNNITFIIPNRGGTQIKTVIENFKNTFTKYFDDIRFIVIEQYDDNLFMRGQLYNIAVNFCDTEFIGMIDNDIYNLDAFDIVGKYKDFNGPYVAFDEITQLELNNDGTYKILKSEKRLQGFGAFGVVKKEDFIKCNGYSNLCFGWGCEDNIFNTRINFKRYIHKLGHISHPRRVNDNPESTKNNQEIFKMHQNKKIEIEKDGYKQTVFNLVSSEEFKDFLYLKVNNIGVSSDYKYINEYKNACRIAKIGCLASTSDENINNNIDIETITKESGLSIIISAYNTEKYIKETLDSIYKQDYINNNNNFEVIIGIDGCKKTLNEVKKIYKNYRNLKVLNMSSNRGTFVTSNTLVYQAKFNKILRFDSDDLLVDGSLTKIMNQSKDYDIVRFKYYDFVTIGNAKKMDVYAYGSVLYDKKVFENAGGYQDWKCSGDYEFFERVKNNFSVKYINECLYYHRLRDDSLMHAKDTSMKSPYRLKINSTVKSYNFKKGDNIKITPATNTFTDIEYVEKYIITMTTWQKRIQNIPEVLTSILNGTVKPDKIVLNLCIVNFPLKEESFPENVKTFLKEHKDVIEINWLKYDTKVWKKSVPTLYKYPNDCVICIDDDFIYPNDFLETFIKVHKENPYSPISGADVRLFENNIQHCGCASLDKLGFLKKMLDNMSFDIFDNGDEDTFFTWCYSNLNNKMIFCGKRYYSNLKPLPKSNLTSYSKTEKISTKKTWRLCKNYKEGKNNNIIKYICCEANYEGDVIINKNVQECVANGKITQNVKEPVINKKTTQNEVEPKKNLPTYNKDSRASEALSRCSSKLEEIRKANKKVIRKPVPKRRVFFRPI